MESFPPLFAKALAGGSTPVDAGRNFLFVDHLSALAALHSQFVGEYFHLGTAARTLMQ